MINRETFDELISHDSFDMEDEFKIFEYYNEDEHTEEIRNAIVLKNRNLVYFTAKMYFSTRTVTEDMLQEGYIGLIRAVDEFDYRLGYKFSTFAPNWIRAHITKYVASDRLIKVPVQFANIYKKLTAVRDRLLQEEHIYADEYRLAEETGISLEQIKTVLRAYEPILSLDLKIYRQNSDEEQIAELVDLVPSEVSVENSVMQDRLAEEVAKALDKLPDIQRDVIMMRYGLGGESPKTYEQIGNALGFSRQYACYEEKKASKALRCLFKEWR